MGNQYEEQRLKKVKHKKKKPLNKSERKMAKIASRVYSLKNAAETELKFHDIQLNWSSIPVLFDVRDVMGIPEAAGVNNRVDLEIYLKSVRINFGLQYNNAYTPAQDEGQRIRVVVIQFCDDDTIGPTATTILQNPAGTDCIETHLNFHEMKSGRMIVLSDKTYDLNNVNRYLSDSLYIYKNFKRKVTYNPASTNGRNKIYVATFAQTTVGPMPRIQYNSRVCYSDK